MSESVPHGQNIELGVCKRQILRVSLNQRDPRHVLPALCEHAEAHIQPDDMGPPRNRGSFARHKTGPCSDIEHIMT